MICGQAGVAIYKATHTFWACYRKLPREIQQLADKKFELLKQNPRHPIPALEKDRLVLGCPYQQKLSSIGNRRWGPVNLGVDRQTRRIHKKTRLRPLPRIMPYVLLFLLLGAISA